MTKLLDRRAEKLELLKLLQEKQRRINADPLRYAKAHSKQEEFFKSDKPIRVLFWGNRVGKTEGCAQEVVRYALGKHPTRDVIPPIEIWCACPSYDMQKETTQLKLEKYLPKDQIKHITYIKAGTWGEVQLKGGSRINFKSYEQGREKYQGAAKRLIWFDEEPPHDIWEECVVRQEAGQQLDIIMSMTPIKGMCFDEKTKLLGKNGWMGIDDINIGDEIFTIHKSTLDLELKPVDFIYREKSDKPMIRMTNQGFDSLTTEDHRWFIINNNTKKHEVKTTKNLKTHHVIPRSIANNYNPIPIYEDWYVSLVGWIVTDGTYRKDRPQVIITQSVSRNGFKCKIIEQLLEESGADLRIDDFEYHKNESCNGFARNYCIKGSLAKRIKVEFPKKELTGEFISKLSKVQQQLLFDSLILGDGSVNKNGIRFISEDKYMGTIEGMMMLCQLLGKRCTYKIEKEKYYRFHIQNSKRFKPFTHVSTLTRREEKYNGKVWCPHTENETVIAMRNGTSYISMNTWVYDQLFMQTGRDDLMISQAEWNDNPWLTDKQKQLMEANLSEEAIKVRRQGLFVQRVGLVCAWWDREKNLSAYQDTPKDWSYYEVLDGGFSDPAAWLLIGIDNDGSIHVIDGYREKGLSDIEIVNKRNNKIKGLRIINGWIDYSDERLAGNLSKLGMNLQRVEKQTGDVQRWDEIIAEKLAEYGKIERGTGKPRLFINKNLDWLVQEIENLVWLEIRKSVGGETQIVPKWDDHRRFGHHFDGIRALGYFVVNFMRPRKISHRDLPQFQPMQDEDLGL